MQVLRLCLVFVFSFICWSCQANTSTRIERPTSPNQEYGRQVHVVKKGETLYSISRMYGMTIPDLARENNIGISTVLNPGDRLKVLTVARKLSPPRLTQESSRLMDKTIESRRNQKVKLQGNIPYLLIPKGTGYARPVSGKKVKYFSSDVNGRPNYGVDIMVGQTQAVKAIHNGVVVFVADDLAGYGKCVLIAHSRNEEVFLFGLDEIRVQAGKVVHKGDSLGEIKSASTLGIKIIRNKVFQDPSKIISGL